MNDHRERLTTRLISHIENGWAVADGIFVLPKAPAARQDPLFVLRRDATAACLSRANAPEEGHYTPPNGESAIENSWAFDPAFARKALFGRLAADRAEEIALGGER